MPRTTSPRHHEQDFLSREIAALTKGEPRSWAQIGHLLDRVEQTGFWASEAKSFSEWLRERAAKFNLKESTLWRYLTAGRYYVKLREMPSCRQVSCPPLEELSEKVSPENLELLSKLARVAPDEVFQGLAEKVIIGRVTRAELRTTWQAYRQVLGGRTARGGGVLVPQINLEDHTQFQSMMEAMVFTVLCRNSPLWTGVAKPEMYQIFMQVTPEYLQKQSFYVIFDAVAIVRAARHAPMQIHGIEIASGTLGAEFRTRKFEAMAPFCDVLWLATSDSPSVISRIDLPDFVGILRIDRGSIIVERSSRSSDLLGTQLLAMVKGLLLKALKH